SADQQVLFLLAGGERRVEPARALAATGPGLRGIGRIAVLRLHLAATCLGAAAAAEHFIETESLRLDHRVDLVPQSRCLFLYKLLLAGLGLLDEVAELIVVEGFQVDCHAFSVIGFLPIRLARAGHSRESAPLRGG